VAYKIATAVALAAELERRYSTPMLPLYWVGSDDVDFAEVRDFTVLANELSPVDTSIARDAHAAATPVGSIPSDAVAALWRSTVPFVEALPGFAGVESSVTGALEQSVDHGEVTARVLMQIFDGGIAVVDGRSGAIRRHARDLILRFFDEEDHVDAEVRRGGEALEAAGFHAQLWDAPDSGVFLMQDGARRKIPPEARAHARAQFEERIENASPGVVLRTLIQDAVFGPAAAVLGPAEIAYRAQIAGLYDYFEVARPAAFPRLSATWVPGVVEAVAESSGQDVPAVVTEPAAFVRAAYASQADPRAAESAAEFMKSFADARDRFLSELSGIGRGGGRLEKRFADVERRLRQLLDSVSDGGRETALAQWPFLEALEDAVMRGGRRQERFVAALSVFLHEPERASSLLSDAALDHVARALDGRIDHVVYS